MIDLDTVARALADVKLGVACAGTVLESRTYRTGKKAFLFLGKELARLKLVASAAEARKLGFAVGSQGWVTPPLDALPPVAVAKRWVAESHALAAGTATKTGRGPAAAKKKR